MDPNIYAAILQFEEQEDSAELRTKVEDAYTEALASDVDLATMLSTTIPNAMSDWVDSISDSTESNTEEEGTESQTEQDTESTTEAEGGDDAAQEETPADEGGDDTAQDETPADEGGDDTAQDETPADEGNDDTAKKKKKVVKVKITSDIVNVRESASTSSEIIGKATKGEKYTELDYADGWFKISFNGTDGYVKSDYVTEVKE
jgi:hypothetical protein